MSESEQLQAQRRISAEIPLTGWDTLIILQRHGQYDSRRPHDLQELTEDERTYGHLTDAGKIEARKRAGERIEAALAHNPESTDFLIINSPTYWLSNEALGQRAKETAEIVADEIMHRLDAANLPHEHLLNTSDRFKGELSRPEDRLGEALMFQVPEFVDTLRKEHGGQGTAFWEDFNRDAHRELREKLGAEGPDEIAERMDTVLNIVARFTRRYHFNNPDRQLVVWMITHGDSLEPYVQRTLGVPDDEFSADYNTAISITVDVAGKAQTIINGRDYSVPLKTHADTPEV